MPRIRQNSAQYAANDLWKGIVRAGLDNGCRSVKDISRATGIPYDTLLRRQENPLKITVDEILKINKAFGSNFGFFG